MILNRYVKVMTFIKHFVAKSDIKNHSIYEPDTFIALSYFILEEYSLDFIFILCIILKQMYTI